MIRFVCGRSGSGKSDFIMNAVKEVGDRGESIILIVPEQQAVAWESRTARELSPEALLNLEVVNFTRLGDRVSREFGGFFHNCAGKDAKQLLMWAALESVRGVLSYYGTASSDKLVPSLLRTVKELHTYRVTPGMLSEAADSLKSGDATEELLSRKLYDISTICAAYDSLLKQSFDDSDGIPEHTAEVISEKRFFDGKHVFVDSFYSYTPAQRDMIRSAMADAESVTVTFSCPGEPTSEPQFMHIRESFDRMKRLAGEYGGAEIISLTDHKRFAVPSLGVIENGIWDFTKKDSDVSFDGVKLIETSDRFTEGDAVAAEICRLVMNGARYSEIAVIARNMDSLEGITDAALQRRGIPHYTARRRKLSDSPAAKLISAVMRVPAYGWRREDIIEIAKTGLLPVTDEECDRFEKYANMWRVRGERAFTEDFEMNPFGYKDHSPQRAETILELVNGARRKICEPLSAFCEIFEGSRADTEKCAVNLYRLLTEWGVPEKISETAKELHRLGYTTESAEALGMWDALMGILDTFATAIPDANGNAESLCAMLSQIISATDVGTIPTGIDEVALGSADLMRTDGIKHTIIVGAVADEFPAKLPSDGILTETDRVVLEGYGIELSDSGRNASGMELFLFYKAVCSASYSVTLVIPRTSGTSNCAPSIGVNRIRELFEKIPVDLYDPDDAEKSVWVKSDLERFVRHRGSVGKCARRLLPEYENIPLYGDANRYNSAEEQIPREIIREIYGDRINLSQSKVDKYAKCPFSYSVNYTLGLEEDLAGKIDMSDTGTFVHKILEEFFRETADLEFPIPEEIERELCDRLFDEYVKLLGEKGKLLGRQKFLLRRLRRSIGVFIRSLNEEFTQGLFRPWRFEQPVGMDSEDSVPAPVFYLSDGTEICMRGVIDRVDVYREGDTTYVRVVDYKTGKKKFSLSDIYEGLNLQLLLYLFTIWKSPPGEFRRALAGDGEIIPAGALYFSARPGEGKSDFMVYGEDCINAATAAVSRNGLVLSDKNIVAAMDREFSGKYAPATVDKHGNFKKSAALADIERFGKLYLDITDIITEIGERLAGGFAGATPKEKPNDSPCEYCKYMPVCRKGVSDAAKTEETEEN